MKKILILLIIIFVISFIQYQYVNSEDDEYYKNRIKDLLIEMELVENTENILKIDKKILLSKSIKFVSNFINKNQSYSAEFGFNKKDKTIVSFSSDYEFLKEKTKVKDSLVSLSKYILSTLRNDFKLFLDQIEFIEENNYFSIVLMKNINGFQVLYGKRVEITLVDKGRIVSLNIFDDEMKINKPTMIKRELAFEKIKRNLLEKNDIDDFQFEDKYKEYTEFFYMDISRPIFLKVNDIINEYRLYWVFPAFFKDNKKEIKIFLYDIEKGIILEY
mgnify:FL=1